MRIESFHSYSGSLCDELIGDAEHIFYAILARIERKRRQAVESDAGRGVFEGILVLDELKLDRDAQLTAYSLERIVNGKPSGDARSIVVIAHEGMERDVHRSYESVSVENTKCDGLVLHGRIV